MSANTTPVFMGSYRNSLMPLTNEFASRPRIIWSPGANGSRVHMINAANNDGSNAYAITWGIATIITKNANMGAPTITGLNTINRTSGSFTTEGWRSYQRAFIQGCSTVANDVAAAVSSLTGTTLVFASSTFNANDNPFNGNIYLFHYLTTVNVPANAGNATGTPSVDLLGAAQLPPIFGGSDKFLVLGPNDYIVAFSGTTITSAKSVDISIAGGDY